LEIKSESGITTELKIMNRKPSSSQYLSLVFLQLSTHFHRNAEVSQGRQISIQQPAVEV